LKKWRALSAEDLMDLRMEDKSGGRRRLGAAVVGGGIGGISAACSLLQRGVDVTVFEQARALGEIGAGVLLLPNGRPLIHLSTRCSMAVVKSITALQSPVASDAAAFGNWNEST
jgi:heterodisulfide reductase subunit A-like polyferredoxin